MNTINVLALFRKYWLPLLSVVSIAFNIWLATRKDRIKTVTTVEYVDRVVTKVEEKVVYRNRDVVKTRTIVKKGDETRVEERTETKQRDVATGIRTEKETVTERKQSQQVDSTVENTRFILRGGYDFSTRGYGVGVYYRPLPGLPISFGPEINLTNKVFTLGVGIGVQL